MSESSDDFPLTQKKAQLSKVKQEAEPQPTAKPPREGENGVATSTTVPRGAPTQVRHSDPNSPDKRPSTKAHETATAVPKADTGDGTDAKAKKPNEQSTAAEKQQKHKQQGKSKGKQANSEGGQSQPPKSPAKPKVKIEYDMPGQTRPTPDETEPLSKFYISLLKQRPDSELANKWCVQHGLCSREQAEAWLAKFGTQISPAKPRRREADASGSRSKAQTPKKASTKPKKRAMASDADNALPPARKSEKSAPETAPSAKRTKSAPEKAPVAKRAKVAAKSATNGKVPAADQPRDHGNDVKHMPSSKAEANSLKRMPPKNGSVNAVCTSAPTFTAKSAQAVAAADSDSSEDIPLAQRQKAR